MAESQEPVAYDGVLMDALADSLSEPRLVPYVASAGGDGAFALKLYLWNSRLAKSFLFPLNIAEVTTRNAMHQALSTEFGGADWIMDPPFALTPESESSRQKALARLKCAASPDDLVAALTFDFWSNLFRREYRTLWNRPGLLRGAFPNLPDAARRGDVQLLVAEINHLRNRIAHHEPIHSLNHREHLDRILTLIGHRCAATQRWVRGCSTVMAVSRTPPTPRGGMPGLPLASTNLRPPLVLQGGTSICVALSELGGSRPSIAVVPRPTPVEAVALLPSQIMTYVAAKAAELGGMIDLGDHSVDDVLAWAEPVVASRIDRTASTGDALAAFFPLGTPQSSRPQVLFVTSRGSIVGVLGHPVTRYA